jgi:hypothetical protein
MSHIFHRRFIFWQIQDDVQKLKWRNFEFCQPSKMIFILISLWPAILNQCTIFGWHGKILPLIKNQNKNLFQKDCKNVCTILSYATLIFGRHLEMQTPSCIYLTKKNLLWNMYGINTHWNQKTQAKKIPNSLSYGRKSNYSASLKNAAILKTINSAFLIFSYLRFIYILKYLKYFIYEIFSYFIY